jgi:antitoxin MazE
MGTKTKVIQVGNSEGFRVPKNILNELLLAKGDHVDMLIEDGKLIITPAKNPREGWSISASRLAENNDDALQISENIENDFDDSEWEW